MFQKIGLSLNFEFALVLDLGIWNLKFEIFLVNKSSNHLFHLKNLHFFKSPDYLSLEFYVTETYKQYLINSKIMFTFAFLKFQDYDL